HGHRIGIGEPFLHVCAEKAIDLMGEDYPELHERRALIRDVTQQEEERFRETLRRGLDLLASNEEWETDASGAKLLPGKTAFKLYDTFGFPVDFQEAIGRDEGFSVDHTGFETAMEQARIRSAGSKVGEEAVGPL